MAPASPAGTRNSPDAQHEQASRWHIRPRMIRKSAVEPARTRAQLKSKPARSSIAPVFERETVEGQNAPVSRTNGP
jgi:hypothetical protein